ncbi:MAG: phosphoglycerate kinase [Bacillota bacterium]
MKKKTVRDVDVQGKRVFVRVDFNVPIADGRVTDDTRIRAALPTIEYLRKNGARVILASHLGRPKGKRDEKYSLKPVAERLEELVGEEVMLVQDAVGPEAEAAANALKPGRVMLLENIRFYPEEEKNDAEFARQLARLADIYVNDAFGTAHRSHASTAGIAAHLPAVAGFLMETELEVLTGLLTAPRRPFVAVIGGAKISDKIGVLEQLLNKVDSLLIGGGMANTFLASQGYDMAESLVEKDGLDTARQLLEKAKEKQVEFLLPVDLVVAPGIDSPGERETVKVGEVPPGWMALDIGGATVDLFSSRIQEAATVFWNGPMGVFEKPGFDSGTLALAKAVAKAPTSVVGGGDTLAALEKAGVKDRVTHASTGGGASLKFLEGKELPGVAALLDKV